VCVELLHHHVNLGAAISLSLNPPLPSSLLQIFLEPTCCLLSTYSSITGLSSWQTLQPVAAFPGCLMVLTAQQVLTVGCRPRRLPRQQPWMSVWLPVLTCAMSYSR
jgi:hypothetical protein